MADYSLKYQCTFDPVAPVTSSPVYKLEILQKDYEGEASNVTGAGVPVLHQWQTDDPKAAIKGSSLSITLINSGNLPLDSFYSVDDDGFKVNFWYKSHLLFTGFLVQDDCSETMVDFTHEINLSATDGLGLLKEIKLNEVPINFKPVYNISDDTYSSVAPHTLILSPTLAANIINGDILQISNIIFNVQYTVEDNSGITTVIIKEVVSTSPSPITADFTVLRSTLIEKTSLLSIIQMCLVSTGIELQTYIWGRLNEVSNDKTRSFLEQTLIDPGTFLSDSNNYQDCYTILTNIMAAFKMCIFQAYGRWNIMRWDELRNYNGLMQALVYDINFNYSTTAVMDNTFIAGPDENTYPETGLLRKIARPFEYVKETFNYKSPENILRNSDFRQLGGLLRTYTIPIWTTLDGVIHYSDPGLGGGPGVLVSYQTYYEYAAPWWYYENAFPSVAGVNGPAEYFIRIVRNDLDTEVERYMVVKHNHIHSYKVEANQFDTFEWSFSLRTPDKNWDGAHFVIIVKLTNGTTTLFAKAPLDVGQTVSGWGPGLGFGVDISGDTQNSFVSVTVKSRSVPFDGLLTFYLQTQSEDANDETHYKDLSLNYIAQVNQSTRITGQTHTVSQSAVIKQNDDTEIFIDDSPRNSISGTLFLNQMVGLLQKRTSLWQHPYKLYQSLRLGQLITFEQLFWRQKPRTILDGTFYGLTNNTTNPYNCNYAIFPSGSPLGSTQDVNFVFDSMPPGTETVTVSYWDGNWHDQNGVASSPRVITMPIGTYLYRIIFILTDGSKIYYYFNANDAHVSILSVFNYTYFPGLFFVPGTMEIDYRNNKFTGTLWEMFGPGESECAMYSFGATTFPVGAWSISGINCDGTPFSFSSIAGTGSIPDPICAVKGSVTSTGAIKVTDGDSCGSFVSSYLFNYIYSQT